MQYLVDLDDGLAYEVVTVRKRKRPFGGYQDEYELRNIRTEEVIFKLVNEVVNWKVINTNEKVPEVSQEYSIKKVAGNS